MHVAGLAGRLITVETKVLKLAVIFLEAVEGQERGSDSLVSLKKKTDSWENFRLPPSLVRSHIGDVGHEL